MKKTSLFLSLFTALVVTLLTSNTVNAQCDPNTVGGNCVKYARQEVPSLPSIDLTYYSAKQSIINHRFPRVGSVAVMPVSGSSYGHLAVVRSVAVNSNGTLTLGIDETNWGTCYPTRRYVTPESRNIEGYFDPAYPSGQSSPYISLFSNNTGSAGYQFYVWANGSGFDANSVQGVILGGWCDTFDKCRIPTSVIANRTSTTANIPVTLNAPGTYTLYLFNSTTGKTSNGKQIYIN